MAIRRRDGHGRARRSGRQTGEGAQLLVRDDHGGYGLRTAGTGGGGSFAAEVGDPDWIGAGRPMAFVSGATVTVYSGVRSWSVPATGATWVRLSPDGRRLVFRARSGGAVTLAIADVFGDADARTLVSQPIEAMGPDLIPGSWSPDGRYFAYLVVTTSNSINADGVGLRLVDTVAGIVTDLGPTVFHAADLAWRAPHTLAYVSGGGRETWTGKTLRGWSPEDGVRDITGADEVGLKPAWSADGAALYFIRAASARYDPLAFFAGTGAGAREIARLDARTGRTRALSTPAGVIVEGVRPSRDGASLLAITRPITRIASVADLRTTTVPLDLALIDARTSALTPLVRLSDDVGFGYYGGYAGPETMAWSR